VSALRRRHDLSGIEDILRIERPLQRAHGIERLGAEFSLQVLLLALANAMLTGAGAAHRLRALDQAVHEILAASHLLAVVHVAHQRAVEIAVTDMTDDRREQLEAL